MDGDTMTQPVSDGSGDDLDLDAPLTLIDYIEIISDTLDEAVDNLEQREVEQLCRAIREKIGAIVQENRRWRPDDRPAHETDRDPNDRWWDR
jgi:hypothetical protein